MSLFREKYEFKFLARIVKEGRMEGERERGERGRERARVHRCMGKYNFFEILNLNIVLKSTVKG